MNKDAFWALIEKGREAGDDCNEQAAAVMERLSQLPAPDVLDFQRHIDECGRMALPLGFSHESV